MKAVVKTDVGYDHMEYMDIPEPEATGDLVKIKIAYSGICGTDLHAFKGSYGSTKPPVVLGQEDQGRRPSHFGNDLQDLRCLPDVQKQGLQPLRQPSGDRNADQRLNGGISGFQRRIRPCPAG